MRVLWVLSVLFTIVSMGLLAIITGQQSMMTKLDKPFEKQLPLFDKTLEFFQTMLENMQAENSRALEGLEDLKAAMAKLNPAMEREKTGNDNCQIEQKVKSEELAFKEKEHTEIEANFKTQSGSWNKEIALLTEQLTGISEICNYMRTNPLAEKLCGLKPDDAAKVIRNR